MEKMKGFFYYVFFSIIIFGVISISYAEILSEESINNAIVTYEAMLKEQPNNYLILGILGRAYSDKKDFNKAIYYYREAIEKSVEANDEDFRAHLGLGEVYQKMEMKEEAKKEFLKTILLIDRLKAKGSILEFESNAKKRAEDALRELEQR